MFDLETSLVTAMNREVILRKYLDVRTEQDVNVREFNRYCLRTATKMRGIIKIQLGILDSEFKGKSVPNFSVKDINNEN